MLDFAHMMNFVAHGVTVLMGQVLCAAANSEYGDAFGNECLKPVCFKFKPSALGGWECGECTCLSRGQCVLFGVCGVLAECDLHDAVVWYAVVHEFVCDGIDKGTVGRGLQYRDAGGFFVGGGDVLFHGRAFLRRGVYKAKEASAGWGSFFVPCKVLGKWGEELNF